jgi:Icc-related predicted phosphoesterase
MRMLFVADLHYALKQFDWLAANSANYDATIIAGDLLDLGSPLDFDVQIVVVEKYLTRIRQRTDLVVSSGNHDGDSRNVGDESVSQWIRDAKADRLFVDGDTVEFSGTRLTICPWWDGPVSRAEVKELLAREAENNARRWIWIYHAPPANSRVCWTGSTFVGDEFLLEWIERFSPDMVLSGHIHNAPFYAEGSWIERIGKTWVFNPGRQIGCCPTYISFDFDSMTATWVSFEGESIRRLAVADG